ncbi:TPM domain-containing protein [Dongia sp.]|uniref:TPM domain-containing protein n=1 Tax=Dongia sp. TaxID=1977262 RepID=UPI0035B4EFF0
MVITDDMRDRIETAITLAEKSSRAELVAVIAKRAGEYRATGLAISVAAAFIVGIVVWLSLPWSSTSEVLLAEFGTFVLVLALLELTPLGDILTPGHFKVEAARRLARAIFLEQGLAGTEERNAVLFFVSLAEHHVEIIADRGIDGKVSPGKWQAIVDEFAAKVKHGRVEEGYRGAIAELGELLATHFPAIGVGRNEIGNRLIEL